MGADFKVGDWVQVWGDGDDIRRVIGVGQKVAALSNGESKSFNSLRRVSDANLRKRSDLARANAIAQVAFADEIDEYLVKKLK